MTAVYDCILNSSDRIKSRTIDCIGSTVSFLVFCLFFFWTPISCRVRVGFVLQIRMMLQPVLTQVRSSMFGILETLAMCALLLLFLSHGALSLMSLDTMAVFESFKLHQRNKTLTMVIFLGTKSHTI
jgi:hypothetical protein